MVIYSTVTIAGRRRIKPSMMNKSLAFIRRNAAVSTIPPQIASLPTQTKPAPGILAVVVRVLAPQARYKERMTTTRRTVRLGYAGRYAIPGVITHG